MASLERPQPKVALGEASITPAAAVRSPHRSASYQQLDHVVVIDGVSHRRGFSMSDSGPW
jgi:hypothetical protein